MGAARLSNQRREAREARFTGEFNCQLTPLDSESRRIAIRPMDVSRRGLGFLVREPLRMGALFWLVVGEERFRVELAYCNNHLGIDNLFRCGLFLRDADGDLAKACAKHGLLLDNHYDYSP